MKGQDELFQLIKSLTPSEKRYFKVNVSKSGDAKSNYLQLFEAVDAQGEEYDEDKLKKKHAKKSFVKYLSAEKKQLREQLMKQMRAYRADSTIDNRIHDLLQDEAFYRDKGLQSLREKALLKAKELATRYERFHFLKEVLERRIDYVEEFENNNLNEPVNELLLELRELSILDDTFMELWSRSKEIFSIYRSSSNLQDKMVSNRLENAIMDVETLRSRIKVSVRLQLIFNRTYSNYHYIKKENQESFDYVLEEYQLYKLNPHFIEESPFNYKLTLANLITRAQAVGENERFLSWVDELKSLPVSGFNEEGEVFQNVYFLEHLFYINIGKFDKAASLIPEIESGLKKYSDKINKARLLSFQYNIMVMHFVLHQFKEALSWCNKILDDKGEIKQDVTSTSRVLLPILHFELGHFDLVENLSRSAYRYLSEKSRITDFERAVVKFYRNMPFSKDSKELNVMIESFSIELKELEDKSNQPLGFEEIKLWVSSRLENKQMFQIIQ